MSKFRNTEIFYCYEKARIFFNKWSPIGSVPEDEYDDLSLQICGLINKSISVKEIVDFTFDYLHNTVGLKEITRTEVEKRLEQLFDLLYEV
jgi:hypothetical protein